MPIKHRRFEKGHVINERYEIEGLLGTSNWEAVYQGWDLSDGKARTAIRILDEFDPVLPLKEALGRELSFIRRINHANLARLLDYGLIENTGELFLVEEFIDGKNLYAASEMMPLDELLDLLLDLCKVLHYLHIQGIVHGTLKPSKVIVSSNEEGKRQLKLLNFGLASWIWHPRQWTDKGVLTYTAPELLLGGRPEPRSDLYSLGILIYQLLTRHLPFGDEDPGFLIQKHLQGNVDMRPIERMSGGSALSRLLRGLLAKDPLKRWNSGETVVELLAEATGKVSLGGNIKEVEALFPVTRLMGREKEMARFKESANRVRSNGRGWTVFVTGEAGIGKTRCMEELRNWALMEGWRIIEGACGAREEESYAPFRQILAHTHPCDGEVLFDFGDVTRISNPGGIDPVSEFAAGRFRDLLTKELVRRLAQRPTLVLLHDFHRADESTITVLDYLSTDIQAHPVLLCVSVRTGEDIKGTLVRFMNLAVAQQRAEVLELEPLTEDNVEALIYGMSGDARLGETLATWIYRNIGGNPFFLEEMLKHLAEQRLLRRDSGRWIFTLEDSREFDVPASISVVIMRRWAQLTSLAKELARWLALIRRPVSKDFLCSVATMGIAELRAALQELNNRQMVRIETREGQEIIELRHILIAEVIREEIPKRLSRKMHRKIAETLELEQGQEASLKEIAMHYIEAQEGEVAVRYGMAMASQFSAEFAHENAFRCLEYVLNKRDGLTSEELCIAAVNASEALFALGSPNRAICLLKDELARNRGLSLDKRAHLFLQIARAYKHFGDTKLHDDYCKKGLRFFQKRSARKASLIRALLWAELAFGAIMQSQPRRGLIFLDKALEYCPESDTNLLAARVQYLASSLHRVACNLHQALNASKNATQMLDQARDSYLASSAFSTLGTALMGLGRFTRALQIHEKAVSLSQKSGSVVLQAQSLGNLAECLCRMGRIRDAIRAADRASQFVALSNIPSITYAFETIMAEIELVAGNYKECKNYIELLRQKTRQRVAIYTLGHANYIASYMNYVIGNFDEAMRYINNLLRNERREAPFYESELAKALRARIYYERGFAKRALKILYSLDKKVTKKRWPYQSCIIKLHLGEVLIRLRRFKDAERYIMRGIKLAKAMDTKSLICQGQLRLGELYVIRSQSDECCSKQCSSSSRTDIYIERAIKELEVARAICNENDYKEMGWQINAQLSGIYDALGNYELCIERAKDAYEYLGRLEAAIPHHLVQDYMNAFGRGPHRIKLIGILLKRWWRESGTENEVAGDHEPARILLSASVAINSAGNCDNLLEAILEQLLRAMKSEHAFVYFYNQMLGQLVCIKAKSSNGTLQGDEGIVIDDIIKSVYRENKPFVSGNLGMDKRAILWENVGGWGGRVFCGPLRVCDKVMGVLYAHHSSPVEYLSESTISLFAAFCSLAAIAIDNALAHEQLLKEKNELEKYLHQSRDSYREIIGKSALMERLKDRIGLAAASPLDILITGESGTGKELVARAIARSGKRSCGKFVPIDCGSLADSLAEAELFGYRKGTFTGALENREGLLEAANGGIVFLDEIANLPFRLQPKLLRVLQEREIRRLGETAPRKIDIQVIAATNKDLLEEVRTGRFRKDLYYRLKAMEIKIPALRERPEDIPLLLEWFLKKVAEQNELKPKRFSPAAIKFLTNYSYPGNVRELINIVSSSYYSTSGPIIDLDVLPSEVLKEDRTEPVSESMTSGRIYNEIVSGNGDFQSLVKKPFLEHQFGTSVVRGVIQRALKDTKGRYRAALRRLGVADSSYPQTMQFLKRNRCYLDFRPFRNSQAI